MRALVRDRAARTGESYTAALRHFRTHSAEADPVHHEDLRRVVKPDLGFAVHVPEAWQEQPPHLGNSPQEVGLLTERGAGGRDLLEALGVHEDALLGRLAESLHDRIAMQIRARAGA